MLSVCPHPSLLCRSLSSHFWAFRSLHLVHLSPPIHSAPRFTLCLGSQSIACHFLSLVISLVHLRFASLFPYYSLSFFLYFPSFFWSPDALYMVLSHTFCHCVPHTYFWISQVMAQTIFFPSVLYSMLLLACRFLFSAGVLQRWLSL